MNGEKMINYKLGFYIMTTIYILSILTVLFSLPNGNTTYGTKDCLQALAEREIAYQVDNSKYKKHLQ